MKDDLYNFNENNNKKNTKKVKKRKKSKSKNHKEINENKYNSENEIVIGITHKKENETQKATTNKKSKNNKKSKSKNKKVKKNKKRINVKIIKYLFLSICIIAAIVAIMTSSLFNIKNITVVGNEKITENEIISLSGIVLDENIYKTILDNAENKILENSYIKSVKIKRKLPSSVEITIEERETNFMIEYGSSYVYINNQGYILEISSEKLDVPIIQGAETENFELGSRLCTNDLQKLEVAIKIIEVANNNDIGSLITRIDIENSEEYKIQFESEEKIAYLGDESDLTTKILNIKAILEREEGIAGEIFVDMDLKSSYPVFRQSV
jgi:cell division protein FtsQ